MRRALVLLILFVMTLPVTAGETRSSGDIPPIKKPGHQSRPRQPAAKAVMPDLPVPAPIVPSAPARSESAPGDKALHAGGLTITPGGYLDLSGRARP